MKIILSLLACLFSCQLAIAQTKLFSKNAVVSFFSATSVENIDATNNKGLVVWEKISGKMEFSVLMKGFTFKKALMQEHFNENYVESDQFPKASFKGTIENSAAIDLSADKISTLKVTGVLTLHGVAKPVNTIATITVKNGKVSSKTNFSILLSDYNIKIPGVMQNKINKKIDITVIVPEFTAL